MLPGINPNNLTALESLDLGDIQSPDGRSHPVTATTPVTLDFESGTTTPAPSSGGPEILDANAVLTKIFSALAGKAVNSDTGKRIALYAVVIIAALILLTVAAFRLTSPSSSL